MHDQRHELKVAGLAKIKSFHFSANYVFGSGFPDPAQLPEVVDYMQIHTADLMPPLFTGSQSGRSMLTAEYPC